MPRNSKVDWIKAKQYYMSSKGLSLVDVAKKFNVSYGYTQRLATKEGWYQERDDLYKRIEKEAIEETADTIKDMLKRHIKIAKFLQTGGLRKLQKRLKEDEAGGEPLDDKVALAMVKEGLTGERELYPKQFKLDGDVAIKHEGLSEELLDVATELLYRRVGRTRPPLYSGGIEEDAPALDDGQHPDTEGGEA